MPTTGHVALVILGLVCYVAAAGLAVIRFRREESEGPSSVRPMLLAGLACGAAVIVWRVAAGKTLLVIGGFDAMILIAWLIAAEVFVIGLAGRLGRIDVFLLPVAAVVHGLSLTMIPSGAAGPSHQQQWHIIGHAGVISLATTFFVASGVAGVLYLFVHRAMRSKRQLVVLGKLPPLESLERFGRWMVAAGFPLLTFGILTGVCGIAHAPSAVHRRELMMASGTFALWLMYGIAMLVIWLRPRLRGPRAAWLASVAGVLTFVNFVTYLLMRTHA